MDPGPTLTEAQRANAQRVVTSVLLAFLILTGMVLMREGAHLDNTVEGGRLFAIAAAAGAVAGFLGWTRHTGLAPAPSFSGPMSQLWLATVLAALVSASTACFVNRTFATPTERWRVAPIESIVDGRGSRWHVVVTAADGGAERYLISERTAERLRDAKSVRMRYARGLLGFDYISEFEPAKQ